MKRFGLATTALSIIIVFLLVFIIFKFLNSMCKLMGQIGSEVISKLFLLFLAGIGVKLIMQGILGYLK